MLRKTIIALIIGLFTVAPVNSTNAQSAPDAFLEILSGSVEYQRADTEGWFIVENDFPIGVGDLIRTNETGEARVTFFEDGNRVEIAPNSEVRIGLVDRETAEVSIEVLAGITSQQISNFFNAGSFRVVTPGIEMIVRGTEFDVRVEDDGRSALITSDGAVVSTAETSEEVIEEGFGVRADQGSELSEVVPATNFLELDIALDGCPVDFNTNADIRFNVRSGPGQQFERLGSKDIDDILSVYGTDTTGEWYRVSFVDGFGWISSTGFEVLPDEACLTLPEFGRSAIENDEDVATLFGDNDALVNESRTILRDIPSLEGEVITLLGNGTPAHIEGKSEDELWLWVVTPAGDRGWLSIETITINRNLDNVPIIDHDE